MEARVRLFTSVNKYVTHDSVVSFKLLITSTAGESAVFKGYVLIIRIWLLPLALSCPSKLMFMISILLLPLGNISLQINQKKALKIQAILDAGSQISERKKNHPMHCFHLGSWHQLIDFFWLQKQLEMYLY